MMIRGEGEVTRPSSVEQASTKDLLFFAPGTLSSMFPTELSALPLTDCPSLLPQVSHTA